MYKKISAKIRLKIIKIQAINIGDPYQAVVPDLLVSSDPNDQGLKNEIKIFLKFVFFKFLESSNDQILWSPPLDTNQEENSALITKYLKLASKECMFI